MAQYLRHSEDYNAAKIINIISSETVEKYTVYVIEVCLGIFKWTVRHRYSEFHDLHEKLCSLHQVDKGLLPPKKLFGNQSESFIKKRQAELQHYLQLMLHQFDTIPSSLATFLNIQTYEIHGITHTLAEELYHKGDQILHAKEWFHISPLQLHAITVRLKLPEPTCDTGDPKKDLGHVLDFVTNLRYLKIQGNKNRVGTSNICMNDLAYDLASFKSLEALELNLCKADKITGVEHIKKTLKTIKVHHSMRSVKDVLLLDVGFGQWLGEDEAVLVPAWVQLTTADFSHNDINYLDESLKLMPRVQHLDLSYNRLQDIQQLQHLSCLSNVNLSHNHIRSLSTLHTRFGNVKKLSLAANKLDSLIGFSRLYSLEQLDVSHNDISQVQEMKHLSGLPCLEHVTLVGNPVTIVLDYRTKVLETFGDRAKEITLDKEKPTQKELDTVAVLLALQKSKDAKTKKRKPRDAPIADPSGASTSADPSAASSSATSGGGGVRGRGGAGAGAGAGGGPVASSSSSSGVGGDRVGVFRIQVEQMREQGGAAWLTLLNQQQVEDEEEVDDEAETAEEQPETEVSIPQARYHYDSDTKLDMADIKLRYEDNDSTQRQQNLAGLILPEALPGRGDLAFMAVLEDHLPDMVITARQSGVAQRPRATERPVHVVWAPSVCYITPGCQKPSCILITTENVHIFHVVAIKGDCGLPELSHLYCIPLMNVQQIVLGYQNAYIRIEEAFVGPQGTLTFLMANRNKTELFLDSLKLAYRRAETDLDEYEDPHVINSPETYVNLRATLNSREKLLNASSVDILLYMLVHAAEVPSPSSEDVIQENFVHSLVITSNQIYLLREDYIAWPPPTFAIGPSCRPQFEILVAMPISGKITGIQMYDTDLNSPEKEDSLSQNFNATNSSAMLVSHFIGYGLKLTFDVTEKKKDARDKAESSEIIEDLHPQQQGLYSINVRVTTSGMRDRILATLTQARKDLSERSPTLSKKQRRSHGQRSRSEKDSRHRSKGKRSLPQKYQDEETSASISEDSVSVSSGFLAEQRDSPTGASSNTLESLAADSLVADSIGTGNENKEGQEQRVENSQAQTKETESTGKMNDESEAVKSVVKPKLLELLASDDIPNVSSVSISPGLSVNTTDNVDNPQIVTPEKVARKMSAPLCYSPPTTQIHPTHQTKRTALPPQRLNVVYPNLELLTYLTRCNGGQKPVQPLSEPLHSLAAMDGEEILNYFHSNVAQIGFENEELQHILWTQVNPYCNSRQEILSCVLLSTSAIYFLSDTTPTPQKQGIIPSIRRGHSRNRSDPAHYLPTPMKATSSEPGKLHVSGIIHKGNKKSSKGGVVKAYYILPLKELKEIQLGLFDQYLRVVGLDEKSVYALVCRDSQLTEAFVRRLMGILSRHHPSPSPVRDLSLGDSGSEQDFYKMFSQQISQSETQEYVHPSKVRFVYPNDDLLIDVAFLISESVSQKNGGSGGKSVGAGMKSDSKTSPSKGSVKGFIGDKPPMQILSYGLVFTEKMENTETGDSAKLYQPRSLVLTQDYIALMQEDMVSYPLPHFAKSPPVTEHLVVQQVREIGSLKKIITALNSSASSSSSSNSQAARDLVLVFISGTDNIEVDPTSEYYTSKPVKSSVGREYSWSLVVQAEHERRRLIKAISQQWSLVHDGEELTIETSVKDPPVIK